MSRLFVIVPCFNGGKYVSRCLDSINSFILSNKDLYVSCVFVNDGSSDDTDTIVNEYIKNNFFDIRYFCKDNGGLCSARNFALDYIGSISCSEDKFVLFLDVDDILLPTSIDIDHDSDFNIYGYSMNGKSRIYSGNEVEKISIFNPFVVSCIISKYSSQRFDGLLTSLEDWDYWIDGFLVLNKKYRFQCSLLTEIIGHENSMSSNKKRMCANRARVANKYAGNVLIPRRHLINFEVNSLFFDLSFFSLLKATFIIFPYFLRRNYLALAKAVFVSNFIR